MALTVIAETGASATGPAIRGPVANLHTQVSNAIGALKANQIFGGHPATMVADVFGWRVDRQNPPAGHVNISVQKNNVGAPSTIATVFVPTNLNQAPPLPTDLPGKVAHDARMKELERATRKGLEMSFASHAQLLGQGAGYVITRYKVTGSFSA
jgi:hypothetical protein